MSHDNAVAAPLASLPTATLRQRLAALNRLPSTPSNRVERAAIVRTLHARSK